MSHINIIYDDDGNKEYEGEIINGNYHGKGTRYYISGNKYSGDFKNGEFDGYGIYYDKFENIVYEGEYKSGMQNGKGIY